MKKNYKLQDLDCAVCAQKMEDGINKIKGVKSATVSFISQRMTVEFDDNASESDVVKEIIRVCNKIEPDCTIKI